MQLTSDQIRNLERVVAAPQSRAPWSLDALVEEFEAMRLTKSEIAAKATLSRMTVARVLSGKNCNVLSWMSVQWVLEEERRERARKFLANRG